MLRYLNHHGNSALIFALNLVSFSFKFGNGRVIGIFLILSLLLMLHDKLYLKIFHAHGLTSLYFLKLELFFWKKELPFISYVGHIIFHFLSNQDLDLFWLFVLPYKFLFSRVSLSKFVLQNFNLLGLLLRLRNQLGRMLLLQMSPILVKFSDDVSLFILWLREHSDQIVFLRLKFPER